MITVIKDGFEMKMPRIWEHLLWSLQVVSAYFFMLCVVGTENSAGLRSSRQLVTRDMCAK